MKAIYILWLRQMKRFFRSKSRIISTIMQPIFYLLTFSLGFGSTFERAGEGNYIAFLVPGIICQTILFSSIFSGMDIVFDRQFGFLKETLVAPVSRTNIMIGKILGGATMATIQGFMVFGLSFLIGFRPVSYILIPFAILIMFLVACLFAGVGAAIGSSLKDSYGFQLVMNLLVMPIFFLSGALFPIKNLPSFLMPVIKINPLSYGVDSLRGIISGVNSFNITFSILTIISLFIIIVFVGNRLFSKMEA